MSVNIISQATTLLSEVVATSLTITRTINPDCSPSYTSSLQFGTHTFAADANGTPISIISIGQNPGSIGLGPQQTEEIFMTPITYNGTSTVLGELLATIMDARISDFLGLNKPQEPTGATGAEESTGV